VTRAYENYPVRMQLVQTGSRRTNRLLRSI
jgi:hypothetical protein